MSLLVKICGLGNAGDVAAAVEAGADAVGFVFAESPREITPQDARAAVAGLDAGVRRVAVMRHPESSRWQEVLDVFAPDVLQTDIEDYADLDVPEGVECWPVVREGRDDAELPETFLYEGADSGAGESVDWQRAAGVAQRGRMILAGGLNAGNLYEAVSTVRPYGVDVSSAVESERGVKDHTLIREFVAAARAAESAL